MFGDERRFLGIGSGLGIRGSNSICEREKSLGLEKVCAIRLRKHKKVLDKRTVLQRNLGIREGFLIREGFYS